MPRQFTKLVQGAARFLRDDEHIEVIQPVRNKGAIDAAALGGAIGAMAGAGASTSEREAAAGIGVQLGTFMAMGISNQRLLLFAVGGVAKITGLLSELPLTEVELYRGEESDVGSSEADHRSRPRRLLRA